MGRIYSGYSETPKLGSENSESPEMTVAIILISLDRKYGLKPAARNVDSEIILLMTLPDNRVKTKPIPKIDDC